MILLLQGPTPDITPNDLQLISDMYSIIFQVYSDKVITARKYTCIINFNDRVSGKKVLKLLRKHCG